MKKLWLVLLFVPALVLAQSLKEVIVTPVVSPASLDSLRVTSGSTTVYSRQERADTVRIDTCYVLSGSAIVKARGGVGKFTDVRAGMRVTGTSAGIPAATYVLSKTNDTTIVLSAEATATSATQGDTLDFQRMQTRFGSVTAGMRVIGAGIPKWTTVASKTDSVTLELSNAATATSQVGNLQFGYFQSHAYATGDALGFPFVLADSNASSKQVMWLQNITVIDQDKQDANLELVLFKKDFFPSLDSAAFSPADSSALNIVAVIPLTTWYAYGVNGVCAETGLGIGLGTPFIDKYQMLYGQLVSRGTPTYTTVGALKLRFQFWRQ